MWRQQHALPWLVKVITSVSAATCWTEVVVIAGWSLRTQLHTITGSDVIVVRMNRELTEMQLVELC